MRLRELRQISKKTQSELAAYLNVSRQCYNNYELNNREPNHETLILLADYFDVSVDYLLERDNTPLNASLDEIEFKIFKELKNLSIEEKEDILEYIRFKKSCARKKQKRTQYRL